MKRGRQSMLWLAPFLLLVVLLVGCKSYLGKPEASEVRAIHDGQKAVVLFRVTTSAGGTNEIRPSNLVSWDFWRVTDWTQPVSIDRELPNFWGGRFMEGRLNPWRSPSKSSVKEGWQYVVLEPGNYYLRGGDDYYLQVPAGSPVVYAGSFPFRPQPKEQIGDLLMGTWYEGLGVRDESSQAERVVRETMPDLGPMTASIAVKYGDYQSALGRVPFARVQRLECVTHATLATENSHWDSGARERWAEHAAALQQELELFDLNERFSDRLVELLETTGAADPSNTNSPTGLILQIDFYRIMLGRTADWYAFTTTERYSLEVAAHFRFVEASSGKLVLEFGAVHKSPFARYFANPRKVNNDPASPSRLFTELEVPSDTMLHPIEEYYGEAGVQLLRNELEVTIEDLADSITALCMNAGLVALPETRHVVSASMH